MVESNRTPRKDTRRRPGYTDHGYDLVDYILGITREIWEERGVGPALERYYADNVLLRSPGGMVTDRQGVVASTLQTLHEFPDRQLLGEDVIWRGDEAWFYFLASPDVGHDAHGQWQLWEGDKQTSARASDRRVCSA